MSEILRHVVTLNDALHDKQPDRVREFAADVANCALMVADAAGVLSPGGAESEAA